MELRLPLTRNTVLAAVALVLGAAATLGDPVPDHRVTLDTQELAILVEGKVDHVTAAELADWILTGDTDYRLLDLREESAYAEYHIPSAEHVPLTRLNDHPLLRNERIVIYSQGGIHSAQAWFLMKARGFHGATMLLGGLDSWVDEVLFPSLATDPSAVERARFERTRFVSEYFGGKPRSAGTEEVAVAPVMPTVEMPAGITPPARKKKKKEGC